MVNSINGNKSKDYVSYSRYYNIHQDIWYFITGSRKDFVGIIEYNIDATPLLENSQKQFPVLIPAVTPGCDNALQSYFFFHLFGG